MWQLLFVAGVSVRWALMWDRLYSWWLVLDCFLLYCLVSYTFRRFPFWPSGPALAKLKNMKIIAHRGGRETTTENTLGAFQNGAELAECIELDVWLTKDEEVVVFHDADLNRMCGNPRKVVDCRRQSLPLLNPKPDEGQGFNPHILQHLDGTEPSEERTTCHHRIPTLAEVFSQLSSQPKKPMVIVEFKQRSALLLAKVDELIRKHQLEDRVIWFSLNGDINADLKQAHPNRLRIMSVGEIAKCYLLFNVGLLPFFPASAHIFGFPGIAIPTGLLVRIPIFKRWPLWALKGVRAVLQRLVISSDLVQHMARRGVPTIVLGVNTIESLELINSMGLEWDLPSSSSSSSSLSEAKKKEKEEEGDNPKTTGASKEITTKKNKKICGADRQLLRDSISLLTDRPEWLMPIMKAQK